MQNIMLAVQKEQPSARAYQVLQTVITETFPRENARLVNHRLHVFIDALVAGK